VTVAGVHFGPEAVKVDISRGSIVTILIGAPLCGLLSAAAVYAALDAEDNVTRGIGFFFAVFFAVPALMMMVGLPKLIRPRGLVFDAHGVHYWQGTSSTLVPWDELAAVGISYEEPPKLPVVSAGEYVAGKILESAKLDKRRVAVEIFPKDPQSVARYRILAGYRREQSAPSAALPTLRWRVPIPPLSGLAANIEKGVQTFRQQAWVGWFARPWGGR